MRDNPYTEARRATEAQALARIAEANAHAAVANSRAEVVTCAGCKAAEQGGDWGQRNCQEMRRAGLCQRQVYIRLTMARLVVELVRVLAETGASVEMIGDAVRELRGQVVFVGEGRQGGNHADT